MAENGAECPFRRVQCKNSQPYHKLCFCFLYIHHLQYIIFLYDCTRCNLAAAVVYKQWRLSIMQLKVV